MLRKILIALAIVLIASGIFVIPVQSGFLLTNMDGKTYHIFPWKSNTLTVGWRHSVELTPWEETYQIKKDGTLSFLSTTYKSYGAGTPDTEGKVTFLTDGYIQVTGIERDIPYYSLFYVPISQYTLEDGTTKYPLKNYVPDYETVQIRYGDITVYSWLKMKLNF
ncbi:DUF1850 domain-containing protein [Ornithinibacillus contaminans]|uniref:DUF1850 domain-containing protein n=1 Tax=Ornithinibacillus contaminans TaxID=694055 RepID=UPI00069CF996|nr:DUF1850 domain-containing protein [Ornithinibacillus contaminans]